MESRLSPSDILDRGGSGAGDDIVLGPSTSKGVISLKFDFAQIGRVEWSTKKVSLASDM